MSNYNKPLIDAVTSSAVVKGFTHNFYRYPARFSPQFVREAILQFSSPGDTVLDPFMGGGTSIVETISLNRFAVGIDLNPLSHFITSVKTTPLSDNDKTEILNWLSELFLVKFKIRNRYRAQIINLPTIVEQVFDNILSRIKQLPLPRQQRFVRCALLKTGQWALDCRTQIPSSQQVIDKLQSNIMDMFVGLAELTSLCRKNSLPKNKITGRRKLFCRSIVGAEEENYLANLKNKPRLVVTSPPYPGVHVLYHRWQIEGRRETSAPYWITALKDGHGAAHYTFGGRSKAGLDNYFINLTNAFLSLRKIIAPYATVIQLVAFSNSDVQFPRYLNAMRDAGYSETQLFSTEGNSRIWRKVPNRKWYSDIKGEHDSMEEVLLVHQLI